MIRAEVVDVEKMAEFVRVGEPHIESRQVLGNFNPVEIGEHTTDRTVADRQFDRW